MRLYAITESLSDRTIPTRLQFITDVSGAGNNFAHGFGMYGPKVSTGRGINAHCD
jgi:hypothetical protein